MQIEPQTCHSQAFALPACVCCYGTCVLYLFSTAASLLSDITRAGTVLTHRRAPRVQSGGQSVQLMAHIRRGASQQTLYLPFFSHLSRCAFPLFGCNQEKFFKVSISPESSEKAGGGLWGYMNSRNLWFVSKEQLIACKSPVLILTWITKTLVVVLSIISWYRISYWGGR